MRRIRDADPIVLVAVVAGVFVLAIGVAILGSTADLCDDVERALAFLLPAAPLFGLTAFLVCVRVTSGRWAAIVTGVAATLVTAAVFVVLVLAGWAEQCTA